MMSICFYSTHRHVSAPRLSTSFLSSKSDSADHVNIYKNEIELPNLDSQGFYVREISKVPFFKVPIDNNVY